MSTINWTIEKKLCRCCHAEGDFINLAEPCFDSGNEEIYVDMIKDCFFINLVPIPGQLCAATYTICESCIISVRDAAKFRKKVATCEEKFKEFYSRNAIKVKAPVVDIAVKEELPDSCQEDDFSIEDNHNDDFDDLPDYGFDEEENKSDSEETAKKKPKKVQSKPTKAKSSQKRKKGRPKKMKEEPQPDEEEEVEEKRKDHPRQKFFLSPADYKQQDGQTYVCTRCDRQYDRMDTLRVHVKTKHYNMPRHTCPYCQKGFNTPAPLTIHKLQDHDIDDRHKCNACKGIFNTQAQWRKHIRNYHMLGERYSCETCEYKSFSLESLYKHKFKHRTTKDYKCSFCQKAFIRKGTLVLHERIHTGDRRKVCDECGQAFVQKASLNYHMMKYHPEVNF